MLNRAADVVRLDSTPRITIFGALFPERRPVNTNPGLIGTKLGNTQIFLDDGEVRRVTAIQAGPCVVLGKRTPDKDGYAALQLGFGNRREKLVSKPEAGNFKKSGVEAPRVVREFRVEASLLERFEVGQTLGAADIFQDGQFVDVSATSKGRGFTGVMKRHNFAGAGTVGHGTHETKRHGGSIGMNMTPGHTFRGMKMPGQHGNTKSTILNLRVVRVLSDENIVLVDGGVPGARNGVVVMKGANKKATMPLPAPRAKTEAAKVATEASEEG
jgi:large subunit ribosomal protein L3